MLFRSVSLDDIAADVAGKLDSDEVAVAFPILSRNRFLPLFRALTKAIRGRVHLFLSCPADEVGLLLCKSAKFNGIVSKRLDSLVSARGKTGERARKLRELVVTISEAEEDRPTR